MTAAEARQAVVRLIREDRDRGQEVTAGEVQRTGRGPRQARRFLAPAVDEADRVTSGYGSRRSEADR